ncbi:rubredoxin [Humibacillus xanthopallidus]|uniref:Rubredoxin n=1 Tax=Humibacillus xanthopallidus TaxID=412689 RepID=A0A543HUB3_9MICO|nr:rubredoxin [Humibacillus xanthopallidus]TQM61943.1 rubredoxin [Humibacillus xanthopallidus]
MTALDGVLVEQGTDTPIAGATVNGYRTLLRLARSLKAYAAARTTASVLGRLPVGERAALEVVNGPKDGADFVRVAVDELAGEEAWICSRWRATHYALLHDVPLVTTGTVTAADGSFAVETADSVAAPGVPALPGTPAEQLFRLRAVHEGHRDAESVRGYAAQPFHLAAEPLPVHVTEARLVDLLHHFDGWYYTPYRDPNDHDKGRFVPQYPFEIGITLKLDPGHPVPATYDDCCTFVEALLVRGWRDAAVAPFTWGAAQHGRAMIDRPAEKPFSPVEVLQDAGIADAVDADELPPPWTAVQTWRDVPYLDEDKKRKTTRAGHTLLIVDVHPETGRLLTLESNRSFGLNGPGFRSLGGVSVFLGSHFRCPNDGYVYDPALGDPAHGVAPGTPFKTTACWLWTPPETVPEDWTCPVDGTAKALFLPHCRPPRDWWASETVKNWDWFKAYYPERAMARIRLWDLRWLR